MSVSPHIIEFDYARMRNSDAAHVYGRLLDVYSGITLGMLQSSILAFRFAYDEFQNRVALRLDSQVSDDICGLDVRREGLLAELARLASAGEASGDLAVQIASRHVGRIVKLPARMAPDALIRAVTAVVAALTAPRAEHFLGRLPPARNLVKSLAEVNGAYARLYDSCVTHHLRAETDDDARAMAIKVNSCIDILGEAALSEAALAANAVLADAIRDADYCLTPSATEPGEVADDSPAEDFCGSDGSEVTALHPPAGEEPQGQGAEPDDAAGGGVDSELGMMNESTEQMGTEKRRRGDRKGVKEKQSAPADSRARFAPSHSLSPIINRYSPIANH